MPRANSYDCDDVEAFPLHVQLAFTTDLDWSEDSKCRRSDGVLKKAWMVEPDEVIVMGESTYLGEDLIAIALEFCKVCPAQYNCARYALDTAPSPAYVFGTWGVGEKALRWLKKQPDGGGYDVIDEAEAEGVPIQEAARLAKRRGRRQRIVA